MLASNSDNWPFRASSALLQFLPANDDIFWALFAGKQVRIGSVKEGFE